MTANFYDTDKRKLLSCLSHGSIFLSTLVLSVGIPIVVLMVSDDPVIKDNARDAINFHLNVWVYEVLFAFLFWVPFLWPLFGIVFFAHWLLPVLAILHCLKKFDSPYRYPLIFRVL